MQSISAIRSTPKLSSVILSSMTLITLFINSSSTLFICILLTEKKGRFAKGFSFPAPVVKQGQDLFFQIIEKKGFSTYASAPYFRPLILLSISFLAVRKIIGI